MKAIKSVIFSQQKTIFPPLEWFWPQKVSTLLFECIKMQKKTSTSLTSDVLDVEDRAAIKKGFAAGSEAELVVGAEIESWRILRTEFNDNCSLNN
jgi:hypothetical protein